MNFNTSSNIAKLLQFEPISGYQTWKRCRQKLISKLGDHLVSLNETQLTTLFATWESSIRAESGSSEPEKQHWCLLQVSLLHYYRRSFELIKSFLPIITSLIASDNRDVCHAASHVLLRFMKESSDNSSFAKSYIDLAKCWLNPSGKDRRIFNAIMILREIGKLLPNDVFSVTLNIFPEIWKAARSSDMELMMIAVDVIEIHIRNLSPAIGSDYAESLLVDCITLIKSKTVEEYHGILAICKLIFKYYPRKVKINPLVEAIVTNSTLPLIAEMSFEFIATLIEQDKTISELILKNSIMLLASQILQCPESKSLVSSMNRILLAVNNPTIIPLESIKQVANFITSNGHKHRHQQIFKVIESIWKISPEENIPFSIFTNSCPNKTYLNALRYSEKYLDQLKHVLINFFTLAKTQPEAYEDHISAIILCKNFGTKIFPDFNEVFDSIRSFSISPNEKVRLHMIRLYSSIGTKKAMNALLRMASYDISKKVRLSAIQKVKLDLTSDVAFRFLADKSFAVRRASMPLISQIVARNPFGSIPVINSTLISLILNSLQSLKPIWCAKTFSLLPPIASYLIPNIPSFVANIVFLCVSFLARGDSIPDGKLLTDITIDPSIVNIFDHINERSTDEKEPNCARIYRIENERWIEKCDISIYKAIANLSTMIIPYIYQIMPIYIKSMQLKHTDLGYIAAVESLTSIILTSESDLNFLTEFPNLLPTVLNLLHSQTNEELTISVLKLTGTMGSSNPSPTIIEDDSNAVEHMFAFKNPAFFTTFVLKSIIPIAINDPSSSVFDAITFIISKEATYCLPYLEQILTQFAVAFETQNDKIKQTMFNELELIIAKCQKFVTPYIQIISNVLLKNFQDLNCIRIAIVMSYYLGSDFTELDSVLFSQAMNYFDTKSILYFKMLCKFFSFSILYQDMSLDLFLSKIDEKIATIEEPKITIICKSLSLMVQCKSIEIYVNRIFQLCIFMSNIRRIDDEQLSKLIINLCLFADLPIDIVETYCAALNSEDSKLMQLRCLGDPNIEDLDFVTILKPKLSFKHLIYLSSPRRGSKINPFKDVPLPLFNNSQQWIEDMTTRLVQNSPSSSIQACHQVMKQSASFREQLFPIAFLSCWRSANNNDKINISNIIKMVLQNFDKIEPVFIKLAVLLDRAGCPLLISDDVLAKSIESPVYSLYFLQRHLSNNPDDGPTITTLLKLNSRMGRKESARGLLTDVSQLLDQKDAGMWYEELGEWEKALEIYEAKTDNVNSLLRSYAHLEMWNKIRDNYQKFDEMDDKSKVSNAIWFAWAYYHIHDFEKVKTYLTYINESTDPLSNLFKSVFYIASGLYNEANECINNGFHLLAIDMSKSDESDASKTSQNMIFAQHLIELHEALQMKVSNATVLPSIWKHRLQNFSQECDTWTTMIEIRSLVLKPSDHISAYLKMLSVLRKERKWRLIDAYWDRFFFETSTINVLLAKLKILWAKGSKDLAEKLIKSANSIIKCEKEEEKENLMNELDPEYQGLFKKSFSSSKNVITDRQRARFYRLQAKWQFDLAKGNLDQLQVVCKIYEESNKLKSDDFRTWSGWAYANIAILNKSPGPVEEFAINAITGFLKATNLNPKNSLEFLCQMFSIFFRYGSEFELPKETIDEMVSLPPSIICSIIPQIVVHIAHPVISVQNAVTEIITRFGRININPLVYALNVLSMLHEKEKAQAAKQLMSVLDQMHPKNMADARLFIDGMHRSAVTLNEQWMSALDATSHAFHANDKDTVIKICQRMFEVTACPKCQLDISFKQKFDAPLQRVKVLFDKFKDGDNSVARNMWGCFRSLFLELDEKMKKTETIKLSKVSEELADKRDFTIAIPGTYDFEKEYPLLSHIEPDLQVLSTQQHPRCIFMIDNTNKKWKFLLKGNEDLRLDQRIMQFFSLVNSLLKTNRVSNDGCFIVEYPIVPLAPNAGLISWVTGADTFQQLVNDFRAHKDMRKSIEQEIINKQCGSLFNTLGSLQRYEVYCMIKENTKANELREILWLRSPSPASWLQRNRNFTQSSALMSISGYIIGLGDRHPSNIMIQRHTGRVIHIDFGDSFEVAMNRNQYAERVPFRLTRMIINALDGSSIEGLFRRTCENILYTIREYQSSIVAQLEVFIHEPIFFARGIGNNSQAQRDILKRVRCKLTGHDPIQYDEPDIEVDVVSQVDKLVKMASNDMEYVRHYIGWCPFW